MERPEPIDEVSFLNIGIGHCWLEIHLFPKGRNQNRNKVAGYLCSTQSPFWLEKTVETRALDPWGTAVLSPKLERLEGTKPDSTFLALAWLSNLQRESESFEKKRLDSILNLIHQDLLAELSVSHLQAALSEQTESFTGSHGDLHLGNLLVTKDGIVLASDLDCFQSNGFFFFDLLHFHVVAVCREYGISWLEVVSNPKSLKLLSRDLAKVEFELNETHILFYVVLRAHLEYSSQQMRGRRKQFVAAISKALSISLG